MNFFGKLVTVMGARVIGVVAGGIASYVFAKTKGAVTIDPASLAEQGTVLLGTYAITHKLVNSKLNPGDAASERLASAEKDAVNSGTVVKPLPPVK